MSAPPASPNAVSPWPVVATIVRREIVRFGRQPVRLAAAVGTPAILWLFLAAGVGSSMRPEALSGGSYGAFLLPGMMTLVAVFASVFSSITIIEERNDGWLQSVLVSPAPRWSIALGKTIGGGFIAWLQAMLLIPLGLAASVTLDVASVIVVALALAVTCAGMSALGIAFAWRSETTAGFHAVMNLVFMPMWLLSGAFFPPTGAAAWIRAVVSVNPLTWCTEGIRGPLMGTDAGAALLLATGFAVVMIAVATAVIARE
ncbi:MAG: ABC transporter permease [Planctomycetota bacterium]|jgi:ABC-2 type transport system permease protein